MLIPVYNPCYSGSGGSEARPKQKEKQNTYMKNKVKARGLRVWLMWLEHCTRPSSIPSTTKNQTINILTFGFFLAVLFLFFLWQY
jgi:hypothetical protein